jgi:hypothetical protein
MHERRSVSESQKISGTYYITRNGLTTPTTRREREIRLLNLNSGYLVFASINLEAIIIAIS